MKSATTKLLPPSSRASWAQSSPSFCAICVSERGPFVVRPLGRNNALVTVCNRCDEEHPSKGGYGFDGGRARGSSAVRLKRLGGGKW